MVKKKKHSTTVGRTTVASINEEMQKPRLTTSVRSAERDQGAPVETQPGTDSGKAKVSEPGRKE
jgi:hypothetical protein